MGKSVFLGNPRAPCLRPTQAPQHAQSVPLAAHWEGLFYGRWVSVTSTWAGKQMCFRDQHRSSLSKQTRTTPPPSPCSQNWLAGTPWAPLTEGPCPKELERRAKKHVIRGGVQEKWDHLQWRGRTGLWGSPSVTEGPLCGRRSRISIVPEGPGRSRGELIQRLL